MSGAWYFMGAVLLSAGFISWRFRNFVLAVAAPSIVVAIWLAGVDTHELGLVIWIVYFCVAVVGATFGWLALKAADSSAPRPPYGDQPESAAMRTARSPGAPTETPRDGVEPPAIHQDNGEAPRPTAPAAGDLQMSGQEVFWLGVISSSVVGGIWLWLQAVVAGGQGAAVAGLLAILVIPVTIFLSGLATLIGIAPWSLLPGWWRFVPETVLVIILGFVVDWRLGVWSGLMAALFETVRAFGRERTA